MKAQINVCAIILMVCCLIAVVHAEVPEQINYQGRLIDGTNLVNATETMAFRLYDQSVSGLLLYQETQLVTVVDGLYSVQIGKSNPTPGSVGSFCSMAVIDGNPAISYVSAPLTGLMYIRASDDHGGTWTNLPVAVYTNNLSGLYSSLVVVNGKPAISFMEFLDGTGQLMYVQSADMDGASWLPPVVVDTNIDVGYETSLAVVAGRPAIAYRNMTTTNIMYIRADDADGSSWTGPPINVHDTDESGIMPSLAVVNGVPAIAYQSSSEDKLCYVWARDTSGSIWNEPVYADGSTPVGKEASLTEIEGKAAIGYWGSSSMQYVIDGGPAATLNWIAVEP